MISRLVSAVSKFGISIVEAGEGIKKMIDGFTHPPRDELDNLICERLWVEKKMHERLCDLAFRHKKKHQRWPNVVFLSDRFKEWFHRRGARRLDIEIEEFFKSDDCASEGLLICGGPAGVELAIGYKEGNEQTNLALMLNVEGLQTYITEPPDIGSVGRLLPRRGEKS